MNIDFPQSRHIPALRKLWKEAFGDTDAFLDAFFTTGFQANHCRCLFQKDQPIAVVYWFDCEYQNRPLAYLYAIATAKEYRGKGLCHTLVNDIHKYLKSNSYAGAILVPGSHSLFSFYEKLGYQPGSSIRHFSCEATKETVSLQEISAKEYAKLRRSQLPQGSVIQEQANLDFLQTQAKFFMGDDFLLTASLSVDTFVGIELLGNEAVAPQILATFGYPNGTFRTPGGTTPFTMYHFLDDNILPPPNYFGFAFDI